ncbi:MAG: carbamoyltransferase [Gammaproteobacteria bacterium]
MIILGLNAFHGDASACLLREGTLVAAVAEERLSRIKHQAGFPGRAVAACLEQTGITLDAVDHVAINRDPRAATGRKLLYTLTRMPSPGLVRERWRNRGAWVGVESALRAHFPDQKLRARIHHVEHHLAHLASAFDPSPFDRALTLSVDGFGDFASAAWAVADERRIEIGGRVHFPHSLGIFYQAMTQYLGFPHYGDEYKVMGLAAYGTPRERDAVGRLVRGRRDGTYRLDLRYFRHHREHVPYEWHGGAPVAGTLFSGALESLLGPARRPEAPLTQRHKDLAASVQAVYEQALFNLVDAQVEKTGLDSLALAGGCGQNSLANGRLTAHTRVRELYVPPAAADDGGAVGAALVTYRMLSGRRAPARIRSAGLGAAADESSIIAAIGARREELDCAGCRVERIDDTGRLTDEVARRIAEGAVTGWYQGAMEWGPRALGHRSILADPRRADMRAVLNDKIKLRESFRPFAPSVLAESVADWFEVRLPGDADSPFMAKVLPVREERRVRIPAVTHHDGTGRVQSVVSRDSPRYHALISRFNAHTGVPMLLNTSFNENEPIVNTPAEALDCFLRTRMDCLVMDDWFIARPRAELS